MKHLRVTTAIFLLAIAALVPAIGELKVRAASSSKKAVVKLGKHEKQVESQYLVGGAWRLDGNFEATLRITNVLEVSGITVTPVLFMADGTELELPVQTLAPSEVKLISINQAVAGAEAKLGNHKSAYGTAALKFDWAWASSVSASVESVDKRRSLVFGYPLDAYKPHEAEVQEIQGLWWKQTQLTRPFVYITNVDPQPVKISFQAQGSKGWMGPMTHVQVCPRCTQRVEILGLANALPGDEADHGGFRLRFKAAPGAIIVAGGMEDAVVGYSATMPFTMIGHSHAPSKDRTLASVGLVVGNHHSMMGFNDDLKFIPYAVVRNAADRSLSIRGQAHLSMMEMNGPTIPLQPVKLSPGESVRLPIADLLKASGFQDFSGTLDLSFDFEGQPQELQVATGSVDESQSYVLGVRPQLVTSSHLVRVPLWRFEAGTDTMVSLWNPADSAENLLVEIKHETGVYSYRLHLDGNSSGMFNISEVIQKQQPDDKGNRIPLTAKTGSLTITDERGREYPVNTLVTAVTFDPKAGTCGGDLCGYCDDFVDFWFIYDPFAFAKTTGMQMESRVLDANGSNYSMTYSTSWHSGNNSILTIDSGGWSWGVNTGNITIDGFVANTQHGSACYVTGFCDESNMYASASGTIIPRIDSVSVTKGLIGDSQAVTVTGVGFTTLPSINFTSGTGITVTYSSVSDTQIQATFVVSQTASAGNHSFVVQNSQSLTSNSKNYYVQIPTSLSVLSVTVLPDGPSPPSGCNPSLNYGIKVDVKYRVLDQNSPGQAIQSANMTPHETGTFFTGGSFDGNIGPVSGYPTSSATTASDGTFHDVPLGVCSAFPISSPGVTASQTISMVLAGGTSYSVRSQNLTVSAPGSASFGHGTITNSLSDISATR
jgi:hypothetical protein